MDSHQKIDELLENPAILLKNKQTEHHDLNSSHMGLYQQLYVPQFNAPNPNMVELEKLYKRYPKLSKPLFILNIVLLFILLFNISHKFNSLSWNFEQECGPNAVFLSFGVVSSLIWLANCFVLAYSLAKRLEITFRIFIFAMGVQIALTVLGSLLRVFWAFDKEIQNKCQLIGEEVVLYVINGGLEIVLILIFMLSAMRMRKILMEILELRERILTPIVYELN